MCKLHSKTGFTAVAMSVTLVVLLFVIQNYNRSETMMPSYQTRCAFPNEEFSGFSPATQPLAIQKIGKPTSEVLNSFLFPTEGGLVYADTTQTNKNALEGSRQFGVEAESFTATPSISCEKFSAYGYNFGVSSNSVTACRDTRCMSMEINGKATFSIAASNRGVFVGTNQGEALLFRNDSWCRMIKEQETYACNKDLRDPVAQQDSRQWYSSVPYGSDALVGEYPGGWIWQFDGVTLKRNIEMTPPLSWKPNHSRF